jgi:hypothetical protein
MIMELRNFMFGKVILPSHRSCCHHWTLLDESKIFGKEAIGVGKFTRGFDDAAAVIVVAVTFDEDNGAVSNVFVQVIVGFN